MCANQASHPGPARKRILLVDDHPLFREGLANWINNQSDMEVCGQLETAAQTLEAIPILKPDLLITDITLPGGDGLDLIKDVRARDPDLPILVLSAHDESFYAGRVVRAGARGYVTKRSGGERVIHCIRQVLQGRMALSPTMATLLIEEFSGRPSHSKQSLLIPLTSREFEVFKLLGEAKSNNEIAAQLDLSPKTVETHRVNIRNKLKLKSSMELIRYAIKFVEQDIARSAKAEAALSSPSGTSELPQR